MLDINKDFNDEVQNVVIQFPRDLNSLESTGNPVKIISTTDAHFFGLISRELILFLYKNGKLDMDFVIKFYRDRGISIENLEIQDQVYALADISSGHEMLHMTEILVEGDDSDWDLYDKPSFFVELGYWNFDGKIILWPNFGIEYDHNTYTTFNLLCNFAFMMNMATNPHRHGYGLGKVIDKPTYIRNRDLMIFVTIINVFYWKSIKKVIEFINLTKI